MSCRSRRRNVAPQILPPEQSSSSGRILQTLFETHLLSIEEDTFAEICWCLNDLDVLPVAAAARPLKVKLVDAGRRLRQRPAFLLREISGTGGLWCHLHAPGVAKYLWDIAPLSVSMTNNFSILQCSVCPPLSARRIHSSLLSMCRSFGESTDPMVLTLASFRFEQADIGACL